MCFRDRLLWRSTVPLIIYYVVEWHLPNRVLRQFGRVQPSPLELVSTVPALHNEEINSMHFSVFSIAISWFVNIVTTNFGISRSTGKKDTRRMIGR
jgi:hypothetical protein